jgi:hypothetical protein
MQQKKGDKLRSESQQGVIVNPELCPGYFVNPDLISLGKNNPLLTGLT